ncbi:MULTISPECIES: hypothetical protein [Pseudomonas]|jgi:hypothetical protein|uniref:hypothetical protein n=1 Tax=Pseudomonas TaxID=286 RepID=UPI0015E47E19|nr:MULTISPECIES: hypothetical protein [Pseudomonas]MBA1300083.1 hypothetical protein [Pseudomonas carnis]MBJ2202963.1 hypothetical protein [Pseudomonas carnis]MBW9243984.1 hypothetical protein [Pseudomonas paracarnis]ULN82674.1 hypothetical protein HXW87_10970 [Pseudomonas sp. Y5-11]
MSTSIDKLLTMLNVNKFEEKEFLATVAASEYVEIKEHVCESLRAIFSLLRERKKHDDKAKKEKRVETEAEFIKRINKELLESDTTYRNLSKIKNQISSYSAFEKYCKDNNIANQNKSLREAKQAAQNQPVSKSTLKNK